MNFLQEHNLKLFDVGFPNMTTSMVTGSNILDLGGYTGSVGRGNDILAVSGDCTYYQQLLAAVTRLSEYRNNDLVKTVLKLYEDAVFSVIDFKSTKLVEIQDDNESTTKINEILNSIDYLSLLKASFQDSVFYGSKSIGIEKVGEKYKTRDLKFPFTVGYYKSGKKFVVKTPASVKFLENILRFSHDDLHLKLDNQSLVDLGLYDQDALEKMDKDDSAVFTTESLLCSEPLFLSSELKIKDYVLKDLISSFLSLIDLIQQDTFSLDGERVSDMANLLKLCDRVKGLMVTQDDMNLLASARLDKNALIRRLFDRVRVIPSISGTLNNINKLNVASLKEKLDTINTQKETVRDEVLTTIGFPLDLYRGSTNRWEVGRQDDRYSIKIVALKTAIENSTRRNVRTIAKLAGLDLKDKAISVLFVGETPYEIQNSTNKVNTGRDTLQAIQDILRTASEIVKQEDLENTEEFVKSINEILHKSGITVGIKDPTKSTSLGGAKDPLDDSIYGGI